jgi:hypothetical protein
MQRRNKLNTTIKPQSVNQKEIKMNTQSNKNQKPGIITIFLVMLFILAGGSLLAATRFGDEVVAPAIMFLFALCFGVIAVWSRKNQWAIIPAGIFATIGLVVTQGLLMPQSEVAGHFYRFQVGIPKMEILISQSEVTGLSFMLLLAATFFIFAILSKKNWWAIIPAGTFASIGLVIALEILVPHAEYPQIQGMLTVAVFIWVLFLGLAATFGALWLTRKTLPTNWTKYPAVGFLAMAVLSIIQGARFSEYWLVTTLLVIGVTLLLAVLTGKKPAAGQQVPKIGA